MDVAKVTRQEALLKRNNDITERFKSGASIKEIASGYDLSHMRIQQILRKSLGSDFMPKKKEPIEDLLASKEQVLLDISNGLKFKEITEKYGKKLLNKLSRTFKIDFFHVFYSKKMEDIKSLFESGMSPKDIALKYDCERNTIYLILYRLGIKTKIKDKDKKKRDAKIMKMKESGMPVDQIAKKFKLTKSMVYIILNDERYISKEQ